MPLVERLPFGRALNHLSFHLMQQMIWQSFKVSDVAMRQALGMGKPPFWGPFGELTRRQVPVLYGYSSHVLPRPCDWPDYYHVTGYWFLDESWQPPADLVDFLNAGAPPVYIGFGSMGSRNPEEAGRIALEALAKSGQRGILASGWGGLKSSDVPDNVHMVTSLPHSWLFPRMTAVVHHGGAGTTAASLRAGVPSVVVPFMGDQPFWGRRVSALGVGPAPIPRRRLTSQRLADAIRECVTNPTMRQKAGELGQRIRADDGIGAAVAIVRQIAK
jgi:sterol 3beta-glucosyltransferase